MVSGPFLGNLYCMSSETSPKKSPETMKPWNHEAMRPGVIRSLINFWSRVCESRLDLKKNFPWRPKKWLPSGYLTVCHGIDGPNRNRWFTVLSSLVLIFHGELLNNQMVHPIHTTRASISLLFSHVWKTFMFFLATPHSSKIVGVVGLIWVVILWGNIA